jgi:hypothetical protein
MSRTYRKHNSYFRTPKTQNEKKQITNLLSDLKEEDYKVSGINHLQKRLNLPSDRDETYNSAYFQTDF